MMKRTLKIVSVIAAVALVAASLAACGGSSSTGETTTAASGSESTATGTAFKIGGIGPLTGGAAIYGNAAMNGAQIAVDEINALGGDIQFEFKAEDDVHDAETSVNAYNNLMDWGMQFLVGSVTTTPCVAVSAETNKDRVFEITPSASSEEVIKDKDNVFQVCFTDPNQGIASADYMAENMADEKIAVIYKNDDAYSQGIHDTFISEADEKGLEIVYEGTFTEDTQTDFSVQLTAAQSAGATLVFLPMYYTPASIIFAQADSMGYAPIWFGVDGMDGILTMDGFDTSLAEGVMLLTPFSADATDDLTVNFVKTYEEKFGETPNQFAADGYDAVYVIYNAIQECGVTADMSAADCCDKMIEAITSISVDGLTGSGMTWDASGAVSKGPQAVVIKDGVYVTP